MNSEGTRTRLYAAVALACLFAAGTACEGVSDLFTASKQRATEGCPDAQSTWERLTVPGTDNISSIAIGPHGESTIYAGGISGLYVSTNCGRTWTYLADWKVNQLETNPTDTGAVYVVDNELDGGLLRIANNGERRSALTQGLGFGPEEAAVSVITWKKDADLIYLGLGGPHGGDAYKTTNGGDSWSRISDSDPPVPDFATSWAFHPTDKATVYAGARNGIVRSRNAGASWRKLTQEDNGTVFLVDVEDPSTIYGRFSPEGQLVRSIDGGETWDLFTEGLPPGSNAVDMVQSEQNGDIFVLTNSAVYRLADGHWKPVGTKKFSIDDIRNGASIDLFDQKMVVYVAAKDVFRIGLDDR